MSIFIIHVSIFTIYKKESII